MRQETKPKTITAAVVVAIAALLLGGTGDAQPYRDRDCEPRFHHIRVGRHDPHRFDHDGDGIGCERFRFRDRFGRFHHRWEDEPDPPGMTRADPPAADPVPGQPRVTG